MWFLERKNYKGFYVAGIDQYEATPVFSSGLSTSLRFYTKKEALSCARANDFNWVQAVQIRTT